MIDFLTYLGELIFGTSHVSEPALWFFIALCGISVLVFVYALQRTTNLLVVMALWIVSLYLILGIPLAHEIRFSECRIEVKNAYVDDVELTVNATYCRYKEKTLNDEWGEWHIVSVNTNDH
jgi:hypothetical protein